jgi:hypothetical protein
MISFKPFACAECGNLVQLSKGQGRTRDTIPIPDDFLLPTCSQCGETYVNQELSDKLDVAARKVEA